jgi:dipeptidyl aminopeptidase/acylaminoacyl peptidase
MKDVLGALANGRKLIYTERMIRDLGTINFYDIQKLQVPVYFFHGMHDNTIPAEQAKRLFDQIEAPKK